MLGDVLLIQPLSYRILTVIAVLVVSLLVIYLLKGEYSRKATVPGYLVPDKGLIKVYARSSSIVARIHAQKGDLVQQDDPIFTLNLKVGLEQGGDIDSYLLHEITEQKSGLTLRLDQSQRNHLVHLNRLEDKASSYQQSINQLVRQRQLQIQRIALVEEQLQSLASVVRAGDVARVTYIQRKETWLEHKQTLLSLDQRLVDSRNALDETHFQIEL